MRDAIRTASRLFTRLTIAQGVLLACAASPALAQQDDLFARKAWHLELQAHGAIETWNYNLSHENMFAIVPGITYGLGKGTVVTVHAPLYYVQQRGPHAYLLGITWGVRSRPVRFDRWSPYWEFEVGISKSDAFTPPGGTRFNYLALGAVGVATRVARDTHLLAGLKWVHVSNNGLAGRRRNPDIEAVGPHLAVLLRF